MSADLVLTNGRFHTMDPAQPTATAVAIRDGEILAVGNDDDMKALLGQGGEWLDLNGRFATPGLVDAHVHFQNFAIFRRRVDLDEADSLEEVLSRIKNYAQEQDSSQWLQGRGWNQAAWADSDFPTVAHLDEIVPDRPAYLSHKSGHAAWVNSSAMHAAGITAATPDPSGGQIQRDADGNPTGILFEDAMKLVGDIIPPSTVPEIVDAMRSAQEYCWQVGLTGVHDFDGRSCFLALQNLNQNKELGLRFVKNIPVARLEHAVGVGLRSGFGDGWLRIGGVKIFADGALGPRTATMIASFEGETDNYGIVVTDKEEMMEKASLASANGLSVTVHAIGDRANHDILDVYEAVRKQEVSSQSPISNPQSHPLRHRIEHVQLLHPDDLHRLAELNVIASMQPIHATSDMYMADQNWGERARYSYAWRTMLESGALLVFGSDAPVERIDPLPGIYAAVTRRRADGSPGPEGWRPEQKLTMHETIHAFTMAAALTSGQEAHQGSITPGKLADLTIYDGELFGSADTLLDVTIAATIVGGEFKYRPI